MKTDPHNPHHNIDKAMKLARDIAPNGAEGYSMADSKMAAATIRAIALSAADIVSALDRLTATVADAASYGIDPAVREAGAAAQGLIEAAADFADSPEGEP